MTNKEIAIKKKEIEKSIFNEKNKIKMAEENKKSYELKSSFSGANKPKPITSKPKPIVSEKPVPKKPEYKFEAQTMPKTKIKSEPKIDVLKSQLSTSDEAKEEKGVGKIFYIVSIVAGIILIAAIVILMIGIVSNWTFWM